MSDLTAIDILVNPDEAALAHARALNARLRQSLPDGFALDATHQPHITTLQRSVHTAKLDNVLRRWRAGDRGHGRRLAVLPGRRDRPSRLGRPWPGTQRLCDQTQPAGARLPGQTPRRDHTL